MENFFTNHLKLVTGRNGISALMACVLFLLSHELPAQLRSNPWAVVSENAINVKGNRQIVPKAYHTIALNNKAMEKLVAEAPAEKAAARTAAGAILSLPMPDGSLSQFKIVESPILAPELAAKFPDIKTYAGQGLDDPNATVRLDYTTRGFHAMILSPEGMVFIDPYSSEDTEHYISYYKKDFIPDSDKVFEELSPIADGDKMKKLMEQMRVSDAGRPSGGNLRTYRLAVATTGEYTAFHGGTEADAMAGIVTTMNRVNGIYEREIAIRMVLIGTNDQIIYTDAGTDPYTNGSPGTMINENQSNLDAEIGSANYDIGHVFGTNSGGLAGLGVVCVAGNKARGVTGSGAPIGDPFDVDYVAHEIGHQFGANHTFNGTTNNCAGGNRNASTAYEPGSGSTIMAYAGICGSQNLQPNSDAYFHTISFDEIFAYSTAGNGNSCAVITATGNNPPVVSAGAGGYTIPVSTPFALSGSASDPNGDPLVYCWEQFDLGPAGAPNSPSGTAPLFRSFTAVSNATRIFPQMSDVVNNTQTMGEILPTITRALNFRLTARDNRSGGGGVDYANLSMSVTSTAGPFLVSAPNTTLTWSVGSTETVVWDVANTNAAPVNCALVNIKLSTDGGYTYPVTLASGVPNDGSHDIVVPNNPGFTARVKVEAADNVFFDISNSNFTICNPPAITLQPTDQETEFGGSVTFNASASGSPSPSVQWQESTDGGVSFSNIPGATNTSLSLSNLRLSDSGKQYQAVFTNLCGNLPSNSATLTVVPAATVSTVSASPNPQAYSDLVGLEATLSPASILGESPATHVTFYIGTQNMGTVALTVDGATLKGSLTDVPLLEPVPFGTAPTGQMAPGAQGLTAVFSGLNANFDVNDGTSTINIQPEDARLTYTGLCFVSTPNGKTSTATVPLRVTVQDITDADPAADANPGDIRNSTVSFYIINDAPAPPTLISTVPVQLLFEGNTQIGTASYNWENVSVGSSGSESYTIGFVVNNYYTRNSTVDYTIVTVSQPMNDFISGGGNLLLNSSAGTFAGDVNSLNNFGLNIKYNKKGNSLKGSINCIVRRTEADGLHVYQIKGNVFQSLAVSSSGGVQKATFGGKANIQDITDPVNPVSVAGNATFQIKMTDRGEPGTNDMISFDLYDGRSNVLLYSSSWSGVKTIEQTLYNGNIQIRGGNTAINNSRIVEATEPVSASASVYPNPFLDRLVIAPEQAEDMHVTLIDTQGKTLLVRKIEKGVGGPEKVELKLPPLNSGLYFLLLESDGKREVIKLIHE